MILLSKIRLKLLLHGKTRALNIFMENSGISGRIQMERLIPVEIFGKKVYPSRYYLFAVFPETTEIFCTICLDY